MTREQQVLTLLGERHGEKLTASEIASALQTEQYNVRSAVKRLHGQRKIQRVAENHKYAVGNSVTTRLRHRWYVA